MWFHLALKREIKKSPLVHSAFAQECWGVEGNLCVNPIRFISVALHKTVYPSPVKIIKFIRIVLNGCNPHQISIIKKYWGMGASVFEMGC
jgi:hypothetical protein